MNELSLREHLERATRDVPAPDLVAGAWARGRRRRRAVAMSTVAGTMVLTAAVVVGVVVFTPDTPAPDVAVTPMPSPTPTGASPAPPDPELSRFYEQMQVMPRLSPFDHSPTYVRDGRVWYGLSMQVTHGAGGTVASAEDVVVPGSSNVGWMAQLQRPELVAGWFGPMGGEFEPFPYQDAGNPQVFAASPGGQYIAMGDSLLNRRGQRIGLLPPNVADTQAWTPAGLVYEDGAGKAWLWNVAKPPVTLPSTYDVNTEGWGIDRRSGCSVVVRLTGSQGPVQRVFEHCSADPIVTVSPGWAPGPRLALTASGEVYDTASSELVQTLDLPSGLLDLADDIALEYGGWWRGNSANDVAPVTYLSMTVDLTRATLLKPTHRYETFIVGCKVTSGECGRLVSRPADTPGVPFVWR